MKKLREFLMMPDDVNLKDVLLILGITALTFPIGYFIVFAPMGWWMN